MDKITIENREYIGLRIDSVLSDLLDMPRNQIQNLIKDGHILVNSAKQKKNYKLRLNDSIDISIPKAGKLQVESADAPINIIYEDDSLAVIDKPAGLVVHPGAARERVSVVSALLFRGVGLSNIGAPIRPGVVHRIDKDTSGVIVLAKTDRAHFILAKQFFSHTIDRKYIGIVKGHLKEKQGVVDMPIARNPARRKEFIVRDSGKQAKTSYKVIKRLNNSDIVLFRLYTGRTHQIRVHMKYLGHPLLGDRVYAKSITRDNIDRQALHAFYLGFMHPVNMKKMVFYSKLPYDIMRVIKAGG